MQSVIVRWIWFSWMFIWMSFASWKFSRISGGRVWQSSVSSSLVRSVRSWSSIWVRRPRPGGVMQIPLGFLRRNLLSAISSMDGISVPLSAEMKTMSSLRPLRCSGR